MRRFSLRAMLVVVALICTWLGWRYTTQRLRQRDVCRELVSATLTSLHAVNVFEHDPDTGKAMSDLVASFDYGRPYVADFIMPDGTLKSGNAIDDRERDLLQRVTSGKPANKRDEFYEFQRLGTYRFYQPIWAVKKSCSACHPPAGSLVAIVRVEVKR